MNTIANLFSWMGAGLYDLKISGVGILYILVGMLVAGHASYHNSFRGCSWWVHVLSVPVFVFLFPVLLVVRCVVFAVQHFNRSEAVYESGTNAIKGFHTPIAYRHYVSERTFDFIQRNGVNVFMLDALHGEIATGKLLQIIEMTPLQEQPRTITYRMCRILDTQYAVSDYHAQSSQDSTEDTKDGSEEPIHGDVYLVVCDINHLF